MLYFKKIVPSQMLSYLQSQYNGEIAFLDNEIGNLFSHLKKIGLYDSSLIILTSDHGELFGEHGLYWHRTPLYEGAIKVPLMIKFPFSKRTGREKQLITLQDIYPTILEICQLPIPAGISGKAFGNTLAPIVSELYDITLGKHRALFDNDFKYLWYENNPIQELYNLTSDPKETKNLIKKHPDVAEQAGQSLELWEKKHSPKYSIEDKDAKVDKEFVNQLKALGYIQ